MRLILASSSKQRQNILNSISLKYEVITSIVEEKSNEIKPDKYVEELSKNKAISVSNQVKKNAVIIAADTIIYANNKIYEKPLNKEDAYNNMKELSGKINSAYTGITIIDLYQNKIITSSSKAEVLFKEISDEEIEWYVNNEKRIYECCGYVPSGKASVFIEEITGDYNTILGISPSIVFSKLKELGYKITDFNFSN